MLAALWRTSTEFSGYVTVPGSNGPQSPVLNLTLTLVTGYNVVLRHRVVARWQELEAKAPATSEAVKSLGPSQ